MNGQTFVDFASARMDTPAPIALRDASLEGFVRLFADEVGERNLRNRTTYRALCDAREAIAEGFESFGLDVRRQQYEIDGRPVANVEVELPAARPDAPVVVVGAHYDSARGSPGANDNATGLAVLLMLARVFAAQDRADKTLRLVAFTAEEPPFTRTPRMGSHVYAARARAAGENIEAMLSLDCLGCYGRDGLPLTLRYFPAWPTDFIAVASDFRSRAIGKVIAQSARLTAVGRIRLRRLIAPRLLPGIRSSDHWPFWKHGYRAALLTDTGPLRSRHYHKPTDRPEHIDFARLARVALLVERSLVHLLGDHRA
jgi:hypothetical protein